jgi:DNA-binding transcriptional LysR family regulator
MNLQQLRYLCAIADQAFKVSKAAPALFTSQPGISKQVRLLEQELGTPLLVRQGNRSGISRSRSPESSRRTSSSSGKPISG